MHISALLDIDLIALETEDELTVAIELAAPVADTEKTRPPSTFQVALDCSGSMGDGRLEEAKRALFSLVGRLDPTDNFGLVVFGEDASVVIPAGPLTDKPSVRHCIMSIGCGGMTNLSAGYLRGVQEARRVAGPNGATLLVVSDGHANRGVTEHAALARIGSNAKEHGVTSSTLGVGLGYDEVLLDEIATAGIGNAYFAAEADAAGAAMAEEVDGLLAQVIQGANLVIRPDGDAVDEVTVWNEMFTTAIEGGIMVDLGSFHSGEERKLIVGFSIPGVAALGLAKVADIELQYVELPALTTHTVSVPVHVNVVPGDQAAGRIPNPTVQSELAFQKAQRAKRDAAAALRDDRVDTAMTLYREAGEDLRVMASSAPAEMAAELSDESALLDELADRAQGEASWVSKFTEADRARKSRRRGP